jgi:hypothetical protein
LNRHINSETYSVFIRFKINVNSVDGIVAYICSCLSGSRTCGTCSNVAAILYYLCYAKFLNEPLKKPGFMLNKFLKEDHEVSDTEEENQVDEKENENDSLDKNESEEITKSLIKITTNEKRPLSTVDENCNLKKQQKSLKHSQTQSQSINLSLLKHNFGTYSNNLSFREFIKHIPSNGGTVEVIREDYNDNKIFESFEQYHMLKMINTCTIDYILFSIWCYSKLSGKATFQLELFKRSECKLLQNIHKITQLIKNYEWNRAKTLWILLILQLKPDNLRFSLFGSEYKFFAQYFLPFQEIIFKCSCCKQEVSRFINELFFVKDSNGKLSIDQAAEFCLLCNKFVTGRFNLDPFFIIISPNSEFFIDLNSIKDIPLSLNICDKACQLLFFTFSGYYNDIEHFRSIFYINSAFYVVDDLSRDLKRKLSYTPQLSSCVYYLA